MYFVANSSNGTTGNLTFVHLCTFLEIIGLLLLPGRRLDAKILSEKYSLEQMLHSYLYLLIDVLVMELMIRTTLTQITKNGYHLVR